MIKILYVKAPNSWQVFVKNDQTFDSYEDIKRNQDSYHNVSQAGRDDRHTNREP